MSCRWDQENRQHDCKYCAVDGCEDRKVEFSGMLINPNWKNTYQPDEIDKWLADECGIHAGCCSSIESIRYYTAREVAEKLWVNKNK